MLIEFFLTGVVCREAVGGNLQDPKEIHQRLGTGGETKERKINNLFISPRRSDIAQQTFCKSFNKSGIVKIYVFLYWLEF